MKAYIIKIFFNESNPLIWRRVILPAGATFNRLNDVIQNVTNFKSGYPYENYHLYQFDLIDFEVSNDKIALKEYLYFKENKEFFKKRLVNASQENLEFEKNYQNNVSKPVRVPTSIKIDKYLEELRELKYTYDFNDNWELTIKLEEIVDDYYFGFPYLLDGDQSAPPEDSGGLIGFYEFLEIYNDIKHPDHKYLKNWANKQLFRKYDPVDIIKV